MIGYPLERLSKEVAYIAYHFNWAAGDIMNMEHHERQQWVQEIAEINKRINDVKTNGGASAWPTQIV